MKYSATLRRGQLSIKTIFSAFGRTNETTLTAGLGYLISKFPETFGKLFIKNGSKISEVLLEESEAGAGRYDVLIKTNKRDVLIEAKLGNVQNPKQIKRYLAKRKKTGLVLVDRGSLFKENWVKDSVTSKRIPVSFVSWNKIFEGLKKLDTKTIRKKDIVGWAIAKDLKHYMEESGMSDSNSREVYIRDMSGDSIELFFRYHIYKCQPKFFNSASKSSYFAPYFTGKAPKYFEAESLIKVKRGITWMARIEKVEVIKKKDILKYLKKHKRDDAQNTARLFKRITSEKNDVLILLLGEPFSVFITPVEKGKLGIRGATGSQSRTFEQLFQAAGKGH